MLTGLPPAMLRRKGVANNSPTSPLQLHTDSREERLQLPVVYGSRDVHRPYGCDLLGLLDEQWFGTVMEENDGMAPFGSTVMPALPANMRPPPPTATRALDVKGTMSTPSTKSSNATTSSTTSIRQDIVGLVAVGEGGQDGVGKDGAQPPELGTWAGRRRVFLQAMLANEQEKDGDEEEDGEDDAKHHTSKHHTSKHQTLLNSNEPAAPAAAPLPPRPDPIPIDDDAAVVEAAWRYRFGRRWAAEQEKAFDPTYGQGAGSVEAWDEALGYLAACTADGLNLQVARTTSWDRSAGLGVSMLSTGSNGLLGESSRKDV